MLKARDGVEAWRLDPYSWLYYAHHTVIHAANRLNYRDTKRGLLNRSPADSFTCCSLEALSLINPYNNGVTALVSFVASLLHPPPVPLPPLSLKQLWAYFLNSSPYSSYNVETVQGVSDNYAVSQYKILMSLREGCRKFYRESFRFRSEPSPTKRCTKIFLNDISGTDSVTNLTYNIPTKI